MSDRSRIEWCDTTWNVVTGCNKVSQGCKHCYAETIAGRFWATQYPPNEDGSPRKFTDVRLHPERMDDPLKWRKPRRVFVNSMSDLFHEAVPESFIAQVLAVAAIARQHDFLILTKRPKRMSELLDASITNDIEAWQEQLCYERGWCPQDFEWPLPNVWLGVSVEDQKAADERIPLLLQTPAAVRFVSYEPALSRVDFNYWLTERYGCGGEQADAGCEECWWQLNKLDWIIMGGESGPGARPLHPDWARSVRDQCLDAKVPFFLKQWGEYCSFEQLPEDGKGLKDTPYEPIDVGGCTVYRVGKKAAGRMLDGRTWDEFPEVACLK